MKMSDKPHNPVIKYTLELGPVVLFFVSYVMLKDEVFVFGGQEYTGFLVVTACFIPLVILTSFLGWLLTGHLSRAQIVTVVLVTLFGGLSLWLRDDSFFKMKPTAVYLLFVAVLGFGLLRGRSYLQFAVDGAIEMSEEGWMIITKRLTFFFLGLAALNEIIWRSFSTETWVYFKTFGLSSALLLFLALQYGVLKKHGTLSEEGQS